MKKLISIIVLLAMLLCTIIMAIPALAEDSDTADFAATDPIETEPGVNEIELETESSPADDYPTKDHKYYGWAGFFATSVYGPLTEDQIADYPNSVRYSDVFELESETYETIPDEIISVMVETIDNERAGFLENGKDESELPTGEEFINGFIEFADPGCYLDLHVKYNPSYGDGYWDYMTVIKTYDNTFKVVTFTGFLVWPAGDEVTEESLSEQTPVETEPAPDETEELPGTGGSEPVAAPKTADPIAVITAVLALSLTACAAVFTVVKEKSR